MPTNTPNFKLVKPTQEEFYNVDVPNNNMDIIDRLLKEFQDAITSGATEQELNNIREALETHLTDEADPHNSTQQAIDWAKSFGLGSAARALSDLNTINAESGFYFTTTGALNTPKGVGDTGSVLQIAKNINNVSQVYVDMNNTCLYNRVRNGSSWGGWKLIIDESMKNIPGGIVGLDSKGQIASSTLPSDNELKLRTLGLF